MGVFSLEIREANKADIKSIARVYVDSWRNTYHGFVPKDYLDKLTYEDAEEKWIDFLNNEHEPFIYVSLNDAGDIIGFASGKTINERNFDGELYSLYLSKESRGLGIGRQLISAIARHFKEKGINSLIVWVMKQNKSGLGFYERMGGKEYIHRTSMFGGTIVEDVAYGWKDISALCME